MPTNRRTLIFVLGILTAFAPLSVDLYLPAFSVVAADLQAEVSSVQLTLSAFFIGLAIGQAFYGPFADHFGRKPPLYVGLVVYILASIGCAVTPDVETMITLRFIQAVGGCSGMVIALAVVRDLYEKQEAAKMLSRLVLIMGLAPLLAPFIGAFILTWIGWRANFWVMAGFGLLCLVLSIIVLPETRPRRAGEPFNLGTVLRGYGHLLTNRRFLGYALCGASTHAAFLTYITAVSFVLIDVYGVSVLQFGWIVAINAVSHILAAQINVKLLARHSTDGILRKAGLVQALFGLILIGITLTDLRLLAVLLPPLFIFIGCMGFIRPNAVAGAIADHPRLAGSAASLVGTLQFGVATLGGLTVGALHDGTARPMTYVMAALAILSVLFFRTLVGQGKT